MTSDATGISIVTGAGSGIGKATAARLVSRGPVVLVGRRLDALKKAAADIGSDAIPFAADIGRQQDVEKLVEFVRSRWTVVDAIVNNAGTFAPASTVMSLSEISDALDAVFAVNVRGPFQIIAGLAPLIKTPGGRIVNVTSLAAQTGGSPAPPGSSGAGHHSAYAASKGALQGLTLGLARELAWRGITVNSVAPGYVADTEITAGFNEERITTMVGRIPLGRGGSPNELAATIEFLTSAEAGYITGALIMVNGGWVFGH